MEVNSDPSYSVFQIRPSSFLFREDKKVTNTWMKLRVEKFIKNKKYRPELIANKFSGKWQIKDLVQGLFNYTSHVRP